MLNALLLVLPIGLGRWMFRQLLLPFKNDLFSGVAGALTLWGGVSLARCWVKTASVRNMKAMASAGLKWGLLVMKCGVLVVLWLGVVATMLGMLCELVLLPLRLPPNQTALIYLYQVGDRERDLGDQDRLGRGEWGRGVGLAWVSPRGRGIAGWWNS
jgi:hypothetical protein